MPRKASLRNGRDAVARIDAAPGIGQLLATRRHGRVIVDVEDVQSLRLLISRRPSRVGEPPRCRW